MVDFAQEIATEATKKLQKQVTKLKCNSECLHCLYTDSPCTPDDYDKNEIGYCSHYKSIYSAIQRLREENKQLKEQFEALRITELEKKVKRLKCCGNCKYCYCDSDGVPRCKILSNFKFGKYICNAWKEKEE